MCKRDDFTEATKLILAKRVNFKCSKPGCGIITVGPNNDTTKASMIGVSAHITAASKGGPRYDESLTSEQRKHVDNGIWLCQNCGKLIDSDVDKYPTNTILDWKKEAEKEAEKVLGKTGDAKVDIINTAVSSRDRQTFNKITEEMLPTYAIQFMKNQSFGSSYSYDSIQIFYDYREHKADAKLRFVNSDLEAIKSSLFDNIIELVDILVVNTSIHNGSVILPHSQFKNNRRKINHVHSLADTICKLYDELIEKGFSLGL